MGRFRRLTDPSRRRSCLLALGVVGLTTVMSPAQATDAVPTAFAGLPALSDAELSALRGGFVLSNGLELRFALEFVYQFETQTPIVNTFTEADLLGPAGGIVHTGIVNHIVNDTVNVELTSDVTGVMNIVQNNLNGVHMQSMTTLSLDLFNVNTAIRNLNGVLGSSLDTRTLLGF